MQTSQDPGANHVVLDSDVFRQVVRDLELLFPHASVLEADELDHLGVTFMNLELAGVLYPHLPQDTARFNVELIDKTLKIFESRGLVSTPHKK